MGRRRRRAAAFHRTPRWSSTSSSSRCSNRHYANRSCRSRRSAHPARRKQALASQKGERSVTFPLLPRLLSSTTRDPGINAVTAGIDDEEKRLFDAAQADPAGLLDLYERNFHWVYAYVIRRCCVCVTTEYIHMYRLEY